MYTIQAHTLFICDGSIEQQQDIQKEGYFGYLAARLEIIRHASAISEAHKDRLMEKYCKELRYLDENFKIIER